jgi:hypothetical protein
MLHLDLMSKQGVVVIDVQLTLYAREASAAPGAYLKQRYRRSAFRQARDAHLSKDQERQTGVKYQCTNPRRGVRLLRPASRTLTRLLLSPTWRSTAFSITVARYEQQKTFRILYPARR